MTMTPMRRAGALAATFALAAGTLAATATTATAAPTGILTGKITQPGGAGVPGTFVQLFQENGPGSADDVSRAAITGPDGTFAQSVPPGAFQVTVSDDCGVFADVASTASIVAGAESTFNAAFVAANASPVTDVCARIEPKVVGLAQVGVPLTVTPGAFAQAVTASYQWRADGEVIPGATGSTFVPTADNVGDRIRVEYVASSTGLSSYNDFLGPDDLVKRGDFVFSNGPAVVGLPILGKTLTASVGALAPGAATSFQWLRNGAPIAGATASTYRVSSADYQRNLSAVITYKTFGYATVVRTVDAAFAAKKSAKLSTKISAGTKKATVTVKVRPSASKKLKGKITISENGKVLKRVSIKSASTKVTVSGLKKGKHKLTVVYEGRKYAAGTTKSVRIKK